MKTEHIVLIVVAAVVLFIIWNNKCNEKYQGTATSSNGNIVISGNQGTATSSNRNIVISGNSGNSSPTPTPTPFSCSGLTGTSANVPVNNLGDDIPAGLITNATQYTIDKVAGSSTQGVADTLQNCDSTADTLSFCAVDDDKYGCGKFTFGYTSVPEFMGDSIQNSVPGASVSY